MAEQKGPHWWELLNNPGRQLEGKKGKETALWKSLGRGGGGDRKKIEHRRRGGGHQKQHQEKQRANPKDSVISLRREQKHQSRQKENIRLKQYSGN